MTTDFCTAYSKKHAKEQAQKKSAKRWQKSGKKAAKKATKRVGKKFIPEHVLLLSWNRSKTGLVISYSFSLSHTRTHARTSAHKYKHSQINIHTKLIALFLSHLQDTLTHYESWTIVNGPLRTWHSFQSRRKKVDSAFNPFLSRGTLSVFVSVFSQLHAVPIVL